MHNRPANTLFLIIKEWDRSSQDKCYCYILLGCYHLVTLYNILLLSWFTEKCFLLWHHTSCNFLFSPLSVFPAFRIIPYPLEKGHLFYPYPGCTETADRELLPCRTLALTYLQSMSVSWCLFDYLNNYPLTIYTPSLFKNASVLFFWLCVALSFSLIFTAAFHEVSVYPKKELPFFILFTAGLCSFTAILAMLTHQFPELMGVFAKAVSTVTKYLKCC